MKDTDNCDTAAFRRLGYDTYQSTVFPGKNIVTSNIRRRSGILGVNTAQQEDTGVHRYRIVFQGELINLRGR
ncbi:hypothetical protein KY362_00120 [Candidatus Woesearchaeota archaeon]|nr:hypothetical protein [Candidatus Woesearchaeota archaeon]